jgi:hypothetical protein
MASRGGYNPVASDVEKGVGGYGATGDKSVNTGPSDAGSLCGRILGTHALSHLDNDGRVSGGRWHLSGDSDQACRAAAPRRATSSAVGMC